MGILEDFRRNKEIRRELTDLINNKDYDSIKIILIERINSGNYGFVDTQILKIDLPKKCFEELLSYVENLRPRLYHPYKRVRYSFLKMTLSGKSQEK